MQFFIRRVLNWIGGRFFYKQAGSPLQSKLLDLSSHELRTLLKGMAGYAEFIETNSTTPMVNSMAKVIRVRNHNFLDSSDLQYLAGRRSWQEIMNIAHEQSKILAQIAGCASAVLVIASTPPGF